MATQLSREQLVASGLDAASAADLQILLNHWLAALTPVDCWQHLSQRFLTPHHPFALHQLLFQAAYADWDFSQGPPPAWVPTPAEIQATHIADLLQGVPVSSYRDLHQWSVQHRAAFWDQMIQRLGIQFHQPYQAVLQLDQGIESVRWLLGARLNIAESCFQAPADHPAIVFQAEQTPLERITYGELRSLAHRVANGLIEMGIKPGEAIAIDLPMTIAAVAIYLGIVLAGGVVVSIADSFAADEIATRLRIANAQAIFTQDSVHRGGKSLPLYTKVIAANAPTAIVLGNARLRFGDLSWTQFLSGNDSFEAIAQDPQAPTNILFSSGTTGEPKAIPWTQTTPIKAAADGYLHQDIHPQDVIAWPTNLGWMMGPWLIYAGFINQATLAIYDGAPTQRGFGSFVQAAGVTLLGVVPSLVKAWRASHCLQGLNWRRIKAFSSTGECSNPEDMLYLMAQAGYRPVIEYCGGTEIGGGYLTGTLVQPAAPATFTTPALGLDLKILDDNGHLAPRGEAFLVPPSIGLSQTLLNRDHHQVYYAQAPRLPMESSPGPWRELRCHGDRLEQWPNGFYRALGRVDDTMNLSGIKVSAVELEQVINGSAGIQESAAIALAPPDGGPSLLVVYVVLDPGESPSPEALHRHIQARLHQHLNPLFRVHAVRRVAALPRTASNKVMRRWLRQEAIQSGNPDPVKEAKGASPRF
ncbi:AMP-binding protein [Lyngbya confervoides]|uniref:AMP-binding protein n=1 Tax=Lyngbya confervoides BDU141951 TaxID=1574623 RepID=A0ABD4SZI2_9CYAN|nr:AMP-binding protein [Lyngbya confervoides]MCM1981724.1 AMP-binding protein [Lyngbya confervoides BDU141951]